MVVLILLLRNNHIVRYEYRPEGRARGAGIIEYSFAKRKLYILKHASSSWSEYWGHSAKAIRSYVKTGRFPKRDMIAWY